MNTSKITMFHIFKSLISIGLVLLVNANINAQNRTLNLSSPDGDIQVDILVGEEIQYSVNFKGEQILETAFNHPGRERRIGRSAGS